MKQKLGTTLILSLAFSGSHGFVWALDANDHPNLQELKRPEFISPKPDQQFQLPQVVPMAPATPPSGSAVAPVLRSIEFTGNTAISTDELAAIANPWLNKPVGAADLESLRLELTRHYIQRGYLNSGALLPQTGLTADGTLKIQIIEGRLKEIRLAGLNDLDPNYVKSKLQGSADQPLNVDALRENFQLLLDDPLFSKLNAQLVPGDRLGEALLIVDTQRARPYELNFFLNNYRPPSIGEHALGMSGLVRNLTGRGDVLDGSLELATAGHDAYRASVGWRVPLNYSGTGMQLRVEDSDGTVIEDPLSDLGIRSHLTTYDIGFTQTLIERLRHRLTLGVGYAKRTSKTYLDGELFSFIAGEPDGIIHAGTSRFWQEYAYRAEQQVLALRSTFFHTNNNLEVIPGLPPTTQPADSYTFWLGQAQYVRRLTDDGIQFNARLAVQNALKKMLPLDGLSIGGVATVRGFRENQLVRDEGYVANLELDVPALKNVNGHSVNLVPFFDYGRGRNHDETYDTISSAGLAIRWRWSDVSADLSLARRLQEPTWLDSGRQAWQDQRVHFQLSYRM